MSDISVSETSSKPSLSFKVSVNKEVLQLPSSVLLATAHALVYTDSGRKICLRALIDTGSETTFITEQATQTLHAKRNKIHLQVTGLGG